MFCKLIIEAMPSLVKFFELKDLNFYFNKPQIRHMQAFIIAMLVRGYGGKITHVSELAIHVDRTSIGRFLSSGSWDDSLLLRTINAHAIEVIWKHSKETREPIYVIIDDTICEKTPPSSKAKNPIDGAYFHKSHLKNAFVYGHQFVTAMLRCGNMVIPYTISLYEREGKSKISIADEILKSLPKPVTKGYILTDSWYSCEQLFKTALSQGYHFIGALKTNRKIYPKGFRRKGTQISEFANSLSKSDFDLVTINGQRYYTYTYLGKINGMHKVKIVITWPENALYKQEAMKAFISTDIKLNAWQILQHYTNRWPVEVFFREANRHLGMKKCQVRSKQAILRFQFLVMLTYNFCGLQVDGSTLGFCKQRKAFQKEIECSRIAWIVEQAQNNVPLDNILAGLKLA
jgi:hypothetical protein